MESGEIPEEDVHLPGVYVQGILKGSHYQKRIEVWSRIIMYYEESRIIMYYEAEMGEGMNLQYNTDGWKNRLTEKLMA